MFQIERLEKIKQILTEQKSADVIWLSSYLKVSEVTIRRDLEKLESEGLSLIHIFTVAGVAARDRLYPGEQTDPGTGAAEDD